MNLVVNCQTHCLTSVLAQFHNKTLNVQRYYFFFCVKLRFSTVLRKKIISNYSLILISARITRLDSEDSVLSCDTKNFR